MGGFYSPPHIYILHGFSLGDRNRMMHLRMPGYILKSSPVPLINCRIEKLGWGYPPIPLLPVSSQTPGMLRKLQAGEGRGKDRGEAAVALFCSLVAELKTLGESLGCRLATLATFLLRLPA